MDPVELTRALIRCPSVTPAAAAAEEEAAAAKSGKAKRVRGKRAGKLGATFVQPQLPFGEAFGAEEKEAAHCRSAW